MDGLERDAIYLERLFRTDSCQRTVDGNGKESGWMSQRDGGKRD